MSPRNPEDGRRPDARSESPPTLSVRRPAPEDRRDEVASASDSHASDSRVGQRLAGRFRIQRKLGAGGMGAVYEAEDSDNSGERVALKVLHTVGPHAIYAIKQEFRALSRIVHPNLVTLHELIADDATWFFTMELVDGCDLIDYLRPAGDSCDLAALRECLSQLVRGLMALHSHQRLHCDVKPSNVLVTPEGRVVLVDFGLTQTRESASGATLTERRFACTPAYASPEQLLGAPIDEASDWYAVGVLLYMALTGRRPFDGEVSELIAAKTHSSFDEQPLEQAPPELAELCRNLLCASRTKRPTGDRILSVLSQRRSSPSSLPVPYYGPFVGRVQELSLLTERYQRVLQGQSEVVFLHGPSGIGKSALVEQFLEGIADDRRTRVLANRCYAREQLPFKAFDGVIDQLMRYLRRLPPVHAAAALPRDTRLLARLFPVLSRVPSVAEMPEPRDAPLDATEQRNRAFAALRQLLAALSDRITMVIYIDDLQWSDLDSARLLRELTVGSEIPNVLWLCTYRSEEVSNSPVLRSLLRDQPLEREVVDVPLGPMSASEGIELARTLIGDELDGDDEASRALAEQCAGHPLLALQLADHVLSGREVSAHPTLEDAISGRMGELSAAAATLLQTICTAGRPLTRAALFRATPEHVDSAALSELIAGHWARERSLPDGLRVEPYHDRVREVVSGLLEAPARAALHGRIADALQETTPDELEPIVAHSMAAGRTEQGSRLAIDAAAEAAQCFAFNRAADLLTMALQHTDDPEGALHARLAEMCACAGRPQEAGRAYERAAQLQSGPDTFDLSRKAVEQYLSGGARDGLRLLRALARQVGLWIPTSRFVRVLLMAWWWILFRVLERRRGPAEGHSDTRTAHAAQLALSGGFGLRQSELELSGFLYFAAWRKARSAGALRAYAVAGSSVAAAIPLVFGVDTRAERRVCDRIRLLARDRDWRDVEHWLGTCRMLVLLCTGQTSGALELADQMEELPQALTPLGVGSRTSFRITAVSVMSLAGELRKLRAVAPRWVEDARESGDAYLEAHLRLVSSLRHLVVDQPGRARADQALAKASNPGLRHHGLDAPWWTAQIALYEDQPDVALAYYTEAEQSGFRPRGVTTLSLDRTYFFLLGQGAAAAGVAQSASGVEREQALRVLRRCVASLRWGIDVWTTLSRTQLKATLAHLEERPRACFEGLQQSVELARKVGFELHASALEIRLEELRGSPQSAAKRRAALRRFEEQGVMRPEAWVRMLAPGFD